MPADNLSNDQLEWFSDHGLRLRRRVRLLMLLDAADYAVVAPLSAARLHAFAYLADVLSPIYNLPLLAGSVMKRRIGPYYPELQWELDRLIGLGMIDVQNLHAVVEGNNSYLDASYSLNRAASELVLQAALTDNETRKLEDFFRQLASALGAVPEDDLDATTRADVTWESGHEGAIIDYSEWRGRNFSRLSAERIEKLVGARMPHGQIELSPGTKVNLYVQYMRQVAHG